MVLEQIKTKGEYDKVMLKVEKILAKSTQLGGFDKLSKDDALTLANLSQLAEQYEDSIPLMPIKATESLSDMIRYKMFERNLKQKQLAKVLGISEAYISGLLSGKRKLSIELAKKLHTILGIDATFILNVA